MRIQLAKLDAVSEPLQPHPSNGEHLWTDVGRHDATLGSVWLAIEDPDDDVTRPRRRVQQITPRLRRNEQRYPSFPVTVNPETEQVAQQIVP